MKSAGAIALLLVLAAPIAGQDSGDVAADRSESALREELRMLRTRASEVDQRVRDLIRLRVAWNLLLEVSEADLLRDTVPVPATSMIEVERSLREEAERTRSLREELARLIASGRLAAEPDPAPPVEPRRPDPAPGGAGLPVFPDSTEPLFTRFFLVPRREGGPPPPGPWPAPPIVVDPLTSAEEPSTRIAPAASTWKRVTALVRGGLPRPALVVIDQALVEAPADPGLHFLRGRALEGLGLPEQARAAFERARELDATGAEGRPGPWARAAALALAHMTWAAETGSMTLPGMEGLSWR